MSDTSASLPLPAGDFWKRKLAAFLHDTPTKCLDIFAHEQKTRSAMSRAGFTDEEVGRYDRHADWTAAAADRYPFPASRASNLSCAFDGRRNAFHHPLDGEKQFRFANFLDDATGTEVEQLTQPPHSSRHRDDPDFWRDQFFAHWRLWYRNARDKDHRLAFLPADTRIPDHTIWNHMQVVSALAGANADGGPAFLRLQIGGVQEFIAQARNTRDLWSGSYLLSWLMAAGLKFLSSHVGPDAVVFPNLLGQPLFDLHWKHDLWASVSANDRTSVWDGFGYSAKDRIKDLLTPNFPNVFLAVVPARRAAALGAATADAIREAFAEIAAWVWNHALQAGIVEAGDKSRFDGQVSRFLNISWHALPWPADLENACALAAGAPVDSPLAEAAERVATLRRMAESEMPFDHRDRRYYTDDSKTRLNNVGLAWSILVAYQQAELDAVRQTRAFAPAAEGGWSVGSSNTKDALIGRDEALAGGADLLERCRKAGDFWPILFKKADPVAALTLIKRTWHVAYLKPVWEIPTEAFKMPNTRGIAAHEPFTNLDDEDAPEDIPSSEKYFAVLALDGDKIGKWVSGKKTPPISKQLASYADGSGNATEGSRPYFERHDMTDFLESSRALSPSYHLQFGEALSAFALKCVRPVVEAFDGRLIYAGGDDVVALLPADTALRCARALRAAFQGTEELRQLLAGTSAADHFTYPAPGFLAVADHRDDHGRGIPIPFIVPGPAAEVSAGIAIAHFKAPLQDVVRAAQAAEKRAKNELGRAAVSVRLMKRSGETLDWGAKWTQGGLDLHQTLLLALAEGHLTAKFPHRLCEVLAPLVNETTKVTDIEDFPTADLVRSEFARLLRQHEGDNWTPDTGAALTSALDAYLGSLSSHTPTQVFQALIGLATAVAFAHRTAPDRQDTHDNRQ